MIFKNYLAKSEEIKNLNNKWKTKIGVFLVAFIFALIIISGPLALLINLMVFKDMQQILSFFIACTLIVFVFLCDFFYLMGITQGSVKDLHQIYGVDVVIYGILIFILLIIIYCSGVM